MAKPRYKVIQAPMDIINELDIEMPGASYPQKLRVIHNDHKEMQQIKRRLSAAGKFLYGKKSKF